MDARHREITIANRPVFGQACFERRRDHAPLPRHRLSRNRRADIDGEQPHREARRLSCERGISAASSPRDLTGHPTPFVSGGDISTRDRGNRSPIPARECRNAAGHGSPAGFDQGAVCQPHCPRRKPDQAASPPDAKSLEKQIKRADRITEDIDPKVRAPIPVDINLHLTAAVNRTIAYLDLAASREGG